MPGYPWIIGCIAYLLVSRGDDKRVDFNQIVKDLDTKLHPLSSVTVISAT